jgi:hypothetical protein
LKPNEINALELEFKEKHLGFDSSENCKNCGKPKHLPTPELKPIEDSKLKE